MRCLPAAPSTIETADVEADDASRLDGTVATQAHVRLTVSDTGCGMDAATVAHIFEPFFTTKPVGQGTGLGLATVYGVVKQSGGDIAVYSEPGMGTVFKLRFPALAAAARPVARERAGRLVGGSESILVVEDNDAVRSLAAAALERMGYQVMTAESGEAAMEVLDRVRGAIDLVLTDVVMTGMTGPEFCSRMLARYPHIRVVFTSGYSDEAVVRHGVLEPGTLFIQKPFALVELARIVRRGLDEHAPVRPAGRAEH